MFKLTPRSWMDVKHMGSVPFEEVTELKALCPTTKLKIHAGGREVELPRFQRLYGQHSYRYSGIVLEAEPKIPRLVQRCLDWTRENYGEGWDGALVNWYNSGTQYIGKHSDDETDLVEGKPILSFSFGQARTFRIRNKRNPGDYRDMLTGHGMVIVMGGDMQKEYTHEITKTMKQVGSRVNITVRAFKNPVISKPVLSDSIVSDEPTDNQKRVKVTDEEVTSN